MDVSSYWINIAKNRLKSTNVSFLEGSVENFYLPNKKLDIAIMHYVLHDIPEGKRRLTLNTIRNLLKEDGRIYIREPTRSSHGISSDEIKMILESCGFCSTNSKEGYSFPLRGRVYEGVFEKKM